MFTQSVIEELKFYVYLLKNPQTQQVFYVGKGKGNRIFNHVQDALESSTISDKLDEIRRIQAKGQKVQHLILRHGLTEKEAFEVEAALIDFMGLQNLSNIVSGHHSSDYGIKTTDEIIAIYNAEDFVTTEPILLININRQYRREMSASELYDATRISWVLGKRREGARYAVAHYRGLSREVYKIDAWYQAKSIGKTKERWAFHGTLASDEIRKALRYKDITSYFKKGAANPIKYVNC